MLLGAEGGCENSIVKPVAFFDAQGTPSMIYSRSFGNMTYFPFVFMTATLRLSAWSEEGWSQNPDVLYSERQDFISDLTAVRAPSGALAYLFSHCKLYRGTCTLDFVPRVGARAETVVVHRNTEEPEIEGLSLGFTATGAPFGTFLNQGRLSFFEQVDGRFQTEVLREGVLGSVDVAIDSAGNRYVSYRTAEAIMLAIRPPEGGWTSLPLTDVVPNVVSMAREGADTILVAYPASSIELIRYTQGEITRETLPFPAPFSTEGRFHLSISENGAYEGIAYASGTSLYVTFRHAGWIEQQVHSAPTGTKIETLSLAFSEGGDALIGFDTCDTVEYDRQCDLYSALQRNGSWQIELVDDREK